MEWREQVSREKRAAYAMQEYWGRPVPGFGDPDPALLIVGLAPAAHGANRTGRMFTGDRSGDWLFASLHRLGLAALPTSLARDDGQVLRGVRLTAAVHCAPPGNTPTRAEFAECSAWLTRELHVVGPGVRAIVALGGLAWGSVLRVLRRDGWGVPRPAPRFGHGVRAVLDGPDGPVVLVGSYHPSQQNTFTGRLTEPMLDEALAAGAAAAGLPLARPL